MQQESFIPSFAQSYALVQRLMPYVALPLLACLRSDLGYRMLHPLILFASCGTLAVITILATPGHEAGRPFALLAFLGVAFFNGLAQRIRRWWQLNRSDIQTHSYYIGSSPLDFRWLPNFIRRNRRVARYIDPLFCALVGLAFLPFSRFLAFYLIFAGFCLRFVEHMTWNRERNRDLDMMDSLIISGQQVNKLDQFEQAPATQPQSQNAIPTGIGSDIAKKIKSQNPSLN